MPKPHLASQQMATLSEALNRFERPLLRYALGISNNREQAEDAVQETFISFSREVQRLAPGDIAPWLFTVCRNRVVSSLRKNRRLVSMDDAEIEAHAENSPAPSIALENQETDDCIRRLIEELPEAQRDVVRLRFHAGLSYEEIANVTRQSRGTVGWLLHCAISALREQCKQHLELT